MKKNNFRATFIQFNSVKAKNPYCGGGYIDVYWFEAELDSGYTVVLPYILDYTYLYDRKLEYWTVIKPLQSYNKTTTNKGLIGMVCYVEASVTRDGFPVAINSILMAKTN